VSSEPDTLTLVALRANDLSMLTPSARSGDDALPLVEAARAGDRGAFAALYDRYVRMVHGIVLSRVHRSHVDDLVQDVFVHALGKLASLREPAAFGGWLATIARNRATDHLRQYGRNEVPLENDAAGPDEDRAEALAVLAALRALPDAYRETLALRLIEGMTGPEIAERTGLTPASVRVNLHRGMKLLRARLQGDAHRE
jgi:RNA polymerase sigma-70 factor, ECF subfamily